MWRMVRWSAVLAVALAVTFAAAPALAMTPHGTAQLSSSSTEENKITFGEESLDGPALWSLTTTPSGVGTPAAVMAWTGIDVNHSVNLMKSTDGLHYRQKLTLDEESIARPAVMVINTSIVVVAWTGTDQFHSLNVMYDAYGQQQVATFPQYSNYGPALAWFDNQVWLGWTGTDPNTSLNVMPVGAKGLTTSATPTILSQYSANDGPSLAPDPHNNQLLLSWSDTGKSLYLPNALPYINFLASTDGTHWSTVLPAPPPQTSGARPDIAALSPQPTTFPSYYWAWTGTDPLHSLNLATTTDVSNWPSPITTFAEQCSGSPALGYVSTLGTGIILIAWTGTDQLHHLNIAEIQD